ncbi:MAG: DUF1566 domain-containing protein [Chromatiales bacterium]
MPVSSETPLRLIQTGQRSCHDADGKEIGCELSGQDSEFSAGASWLAPRFLQQDDRVTDSLTDLIWTRSANLAEFPLNWQESLVDSSRFQPALPSDQPFESVCDVYWSSTTSLYEPDWAWALYLDKGAVGVGMKRFARFYVWAVKEVC